LGLLDRNWYAVSHLGDFVGVKGNVKEEEKEKDEWILEIVL
jgi:hypothetical protein